MKIEEDYPLSANLIKNEMAHHTSDFTNLGDIMNRTPLYVLKAMEHHLQGEQ